MAKYRVLQELETRELVHAECDDFDTEEEAFDWIKKNEDQYPESSFWIETIYENFF